MNNYKAGMSVLTLLLAPSLVPAVAAAASPADLQSRVDGQDSFGSAMLAGLPLAFVENRGQWDARARFMARQGGMATWFETDAMTLQLRKQGAEGRGAVVRLAFEGAAADRRLEGEDRQPGTFSYYLGNDSSKWQTNVPSYSAVVYREIYSGIDIRVRDNGGTLEYDILAAPGADLGQIVIYCDGVDGLDVRDDGSLLMQTETGSIVQRPPVTWHELPSGARQPVACNYRKLDDTRYGFEVPHPDSRWPLVIDPALEWSTFIGGSMSEKAKDLHVDESGVVTVVGFTSSWDFPQPPPTDVLPEFDAFITRLDASGSTQMFTVFLGGEGTDLAHAVAVSDSGEITLGGQTQAPDFPIEPFPGALQSTFGGQTDGFVARFSNVGDLVYSTYFGGDENDNISGLALDSANAVLVTGKTESPPDPDFHATPGAYADSLNGNSDAFVCRFTLNGNGNDDLTYFTYLGGFGKDEAFDLIVDPGDHAIVVGAAGDGFPTTVGAYQEIFSGGKPDGFVSHMSLDGNGASDLLDSTYLGGSDADEARAVVFDSPGLITVAGVTRSADFPTGTAYDPDFNGGLWDAFVARLDINQTGTDQLTYWTYLGGQGDDQAMALASDGADAVVVAGFTASSGFPTVGGIHAHAGGNDGFVSRLDLTQAGLEQLTYSTFLGGSGADRIEAIAVHATATATVTGWTNSTDFPTTLGAFDETYNGNDDPDKADDDVFVSRLNLAADLPPHMIVVLDETGSMCRVRINDHTRCQDALLFARAAVGEFGIAHPDGLVSVWTFAHPPGPTNRTNGFVGHVEATAVLDLFPTLPPPPPTCAGCSGMTPLAQAICTSIDTYPAAQPSADRYLYVYSDGFENWSSGECSGFHAQIGNWCSDDPPDKIAFEEGSWQRKVCDKIAAVGIDHRNIWYLDDFWVRRGDPRIDVETGREVRGALDDEFFDAIATFGGYTRVPDGDPDVPPPTGACCMPDGTCAAGEFEFMCGLMGGIYQGDDTACADVECPRACCLGDDTCTVDTPTACGGQGGTPQPAGETCSVPEACCLPGNVCSDLDPLCCLAEGGTPRGIGTSCGTIKSCCLAGGACQIMDEQCCLARGGLPKDEACLGDLDGDFIDDRCEDPVACCMLDDTCATKTPDDCDAAGGVTQGPRTWCSEQPGACCLPNNVCQMADPICCFEELGGTPRLGGECLQPEACVMPGGGCQEVDPICCVENGGTPSGAGSTCTVVEACCLPDGTCQMLDPLSCEVAGGVTHAGESCTAVQGCCFGDGSCEDLDPLCCADLGGTSHGLGLLCVASQACNLSLPDRCEEIEPTCCTSLGGAPQGPGSNCDPEACCLATGECINTSAFSCAAQGGTPLGQGTSCAAPQACCLGDACDDLDPRCCTELGGTPQGVGTSCGVEEVCCFAGGDCTVADPLCFDELGCEVPVACCLPFGACQDQLTVGECMSAGGTPKAPGVPCAPAEACCLPNGLCLDTDSACCVMASGTSQGAGTTCDPIGACILPDESCIETTEDCCLDAIGTYLNDGTHCAFCGDGACDAGEDQCSCFVDCGVPPPTEDPDSTCADGLDNDCDGLTDDDDVDCKVGIPTVSEWGMVAMILLMLTAGTVILRRHQPTQA